MSELSELGKILDTIGALITSNRNLAVKSFGILFLGKVFDEDVETKEIQDPTQLLLNTDWFDRDGVPKV